MPLIKELQLRNFQHLVEILLEDNTQDVVLFRGQREDKTPIPMLGRITLDRPLLEAEEQILNEFQLQSLPFLDKIPRTRLEWLSLGQHHGLPTRLLDWTPNPLSALWFATERPPVNSNPGCLWIFKPKPDDLIQEPEQDPCALNTVKVHHPSTITGRIKAQSGWFTIHPFDINSNSFLLAHDHSAGDFVKLLIPHDQFAKFRFHLDQMGINRSSLFPDLDGLCGHIEWLHSRYADESMLKRDTKLADWKL